MIKFYFHTNNPAKRRAEKWLTKHGLDFQSRNLNKDPLTRDEVLQLLELSPDGTETLVSERSKATKELYAKHPAPTMNQLIDAIQETPQILKSPLIVSGHKMLTGFNADKMGFWFLISSGAWNCRNSWASLTVAAQVKPCSWPTISLQPCLNR